MTEPVSNVMIVITTYTPVAVHAPALTVDPIGASNWLPRWMSSRYTQERDIYLKPWRSIRPESSSPHAATSRKEEVLTALISACSMPACAVFHQAPQRTPVSSLKLAVNPSCRAYLKLEEQKEFSAKPNSKKLRELVCTISEEQKTTVAVPQDAVRIAFDPVRTVRLQPFFVSQPMFSPA